MERQQVRAGTELDVLGTHQRLGYQQVGRRHGFPGSGEVLADPRLAQAVPIGHLKAVKVPLVRIPGGALRRVRRHEEQSELHREPPYLASGDADHGCKGYSISCEPSAVGRLHYLPARKSIYRHRLTQGNRTVIGIRVITLTPVSSTGQAPTLSLRERGTVDRSQPRSKAASPSVTEAAKRA